MSFSTTVRRNDYVGNGSVSAYSYTFKVFAASHIRVFETNADGVQTELLQPSQFTVSGVGLNSGGTVTRVAGNLPTGWKWTILRSLPINQETDLRNQGGYFPEDIENELDRRAMVDLQQQDEIDRSLRVPVGSSATTNVPAPIEGRFLAWVGGAWAWISSTAGTAAQLALDLAASAGSSLIGFIQSATGATPRTVQNKLREIYVSPEDFGAVGDFNPVTFTGTNDAPAWNVMLNWLRTEVSSDGFGVSQFTRFSIMCRPGAIYRLDSSLNFTGFRSRGVHVYFNGATLYSVGITNKPMIDAIWSRGLYFHDGTLYAENGATSGSFVQPSYGIVIGRKNSDDASEHHFMNMRVIGWFNNACLMNIAGELVSYTKCTLENYTARSTDYNGLCVHVTDNNESSYTSDFQTMGTLPVFGTNEQLFTQCNINAAQGVPVRLNGTLNSCKFHQCYAAVIGLRPAVILKGDFKKLELDLHVETSAAGANVEFDCQSNNVRIYGFRLRDHASQAVDLMRRNGATGSPFIYNGLIEVEGWDGINAATAKLAATGSAIDFNGDLYIGTTTASHHNLTGFSAFRGSLHTQASSAAVTNYPLSGYVYVFGVDEYPFLIGPQGVSANVFGAWRVGELRDSNNTKVVGNRDAGWTAATGTANKGAFATGTATTSDCAQRIKALEDALRTHGLIN